MSAADGKLNRFDLSAMQRAVDLALSTEKKGNVPVGALITLEQTVIAEGANEMFAPEFHPGRHAEQQALRSVPQELWLQAKEMTCYTTLEPCAMCLGSLLVHGIERIVFGSLDPLGGGVCLIPHLPRFFHSKEQRYQIVGPVLSEICDPLAKRVIEHFSGEE